MMELLFGPGLLFRNAVLGGLLVALVCSLLGVYVVLRRMVLLGVALPQAGAAGLAAAFWLSGHAHEPGGTHVGALAGSLLATFGALGLLLAAQRGGRSPAEWGVGALFAVASAATVLFVAVNPMGDLEVTNLLRGELLTLSDSDLALLAGASCAALLLFFAFRREILLASFDPEFARTVGRRPARADALLFLLLGGAIALGVMDAGPLVVFGFLVLPALAALRVAPGLGAALAIAAALGALCSVGGFALAYGADLPTGPTSVALAACCWLAAAAGARLAPRLRRRASARAAVALLALLAPLAGGGVLGCGLLFGMKPAEPGPLSPGTLPDLAGRPPVAVARFRNDTGAPLRVPGGNPLKEIQRAVRPTDDPGWTVPDALQAQAVWELARRGVAVRSFDESRSALPSVPADPTAAAQLARESGQAGPVLFGRLRRFTMTQTGLLLVRLDLALVEPASGELLWTGSAQRPVSIRSALTIQQVLVDAAPTIFAEAFGNR
jgi:ABC-type Mn2+/Zn2+ transport system permease subunit